MLGESDFGVRIGFPQTPQRLLRLSKTATSGVHQLFDPEVRNQDLWKAIHFWNVIPADLGRLIWPCPAEAIRANRVAAPIAARQSHKRRTGAVSSVAV